MQTADISIYIPRVEKHHDVKYICKVFKDQQFGTVYKVDFVNKTNGKGQIYNGAVVSFVEFDDNPQTDAIIIRIKKDEEVKFNHCTKYFWILTRHKENTGELSGDIKIDRNHINYLLESTESNQSNERLIAKLKEQVYLLNKSNILFNQENEKMYKAVVDYREMTRENTHLKLQLIDRKSDYDNLHYEYTKKAHECELLKIENKKIIDENNELYSMM